MKVNSSILLLLIFLMLSGVQAWSQKMFTEGKITYSVTVYAPDQKSVPQQGLFTISIKNNRVLQELEVAGGFEQKSITRFKSQKYISLKTVNDIDYAIEMDLKSIIQENSPYRGAQWVDGRQIRKLRDYTIYAASLEYKNGRKFPFFYIAEYQLEHPEIFEFMPEIEVLPAIFELPLNQGFKMRFELISVLELAIENEVFLVPEGYRIISEQEYRELKH